MSTGPDEPAAGTAAPELPTFDLAGAFRARQQQLETDLGLGRTVVAHGPTLGDATELDWRGMLADFLPRRYGVTKAFVVDVDGHLSDQLDVVIHDRHFSPLLFEVGGAHFIPAESVYAVLEVKQDISKEQVVYAGEKIASVRRLRRTSVGFLTATGRARAQPPKHILGGLLALNSSWNPMFGEPLRNALRERDEKSVIDLACVLRAGSFEAEDTGTPDKLAVCDEPQTALIFFMLRLMKRLQDVATVTAMDLDAYTESVWPGALREG
jgi:hypothetical protein